MRQLAGFVRWLVACGLLLVACVPGSLAAGPEQPPFLGEGAARAVAPAVSAPLAGFQDSVVLSGLTHPTVVRFASDGRVFVAEKSGLVKEFDSLADTTPTQVIDLRSETDDYWDRGLLGMALDPGFPASPYLYLLYTYDAPPGQTAPRWNDACPTPPGPTTDGCVVTGKLVRATLSGNVASSTQTLLSNEWCQQYPSHSIGDLEFGPDGALYVSGGDGSSFTFTDYGQGGGSSGSPTPANPCGDPPSPVGTALSPPTAEGGSLRSQSTRRPAGEPVLLNGAILRVDPASGQPLPDNPSSDTRVNAKRTIAYGMRNPFRFTFRPGTSELWVGDVGWDTWEEVDRITSPTASVRNLGWPCYEGSARQPGYDSANLNQCETLYSAGAGAVLAPYYSYQHGVAVVPGESCPTSNGSVISGIAFYAGGSYPASYNGALFFADHSRNCIWAMPTTSGQPDPAKLQTFVSGAANPVDIQPGPGGDLFYVDFDGGTIHRISYTGGGSCSSGQYTASYYANQTLSGTPALTRCETAPLNHDWGAGSPDPALPADHFSARWTGSFSFNAGSYDFTATADDGIRVSLDGTQIINAWIDQPPTSYTSRRSLSAGQHTITVDYYENAGGAVAKLDWAPSPTGQSPDLALGKPATASSVEASSLTADKANDGDSTSRWSSAFQDNQWWQVDLGSPQQINTVSLNWEAAYASSYKIQVSSDGSSFSDAAAVTASAPGWKTTSFTTRSARYVRVLGVTRATPYGISLWDAQVFGPASTGSPPTPVIDTPASTLTWAVGDEISFSGHATDPDQGTLPASALTWTEIIHHCTTPTSCHTHTVQTFPGVASGTLNAPDHDYPSWLELQLTATDDTGQSATASLRLDPKTVDLTFTSVPAGLSLTVGSTGSTTPFTRTVIQKSQNTISAPSPQTLNGTSYAFQGWSDGGAATHTITAPTSNATYTATYQAQTSGCTGGQYQARYYANQTLSGSPVLTRCEQAPLAYNWGTGSPDPSVPADHFSASWSGSFTFQAGAYVFTATADDGIRVRLDGTLIVDAWVDQPPTTYTSTRTLTAGAHTVSVEYYENAGGAVAQLDWALAPTGGGVPVSTAAPTLSGLAGQGQTLTTTNGTWTNSPTSYAYQWQRCDTSGGNCQPIAGATGQTYKLQAADVGQTVRAQVTASNGSGASQPASSAATATVRADKALAKPASSSSVETTSLSADKANDGDSTTRWSSSFADNQWWQVDLGSSQQVDTVALNWETAYASSYKLQGSSDGTTFTDLASVSASSAGWKITTFTATSIRYLRVLGVTRATQWGISLWDAQAF